MEHPLASSPWEQWDNMHKTEDSSAVPVPMMSGTNRIQSPILELEVKPQFNLT